MKVVVRKKYLGGHILYRSLDPPKNGVIAIAAIVAGIVAEIVYTFLYMFQEDLGIDYLPYFYF